jgi:DNA polymerase elongation subunit (family B)
MTQNQHTKPRKTAKTVTTKVLVKRALKKGFKSKPPPGKKYLKNLEIGSIFKVGLLTGILISITPTAAKVLIIDSKHHESDDNYYLGKQSIGLESEIMEANL